MEYQDEEGRVYEISYSQKLLQESNTLKKLILGVLGLILLMLAIMQLKGGLLTTILRNMVC